LKLTKRCYSTMTDVFRYGVSHCPSQGNKIARPFLEKMNSFIALQIVTLIF
jgi:hypothetical protein